MAERYLALRAVANDMRPRIKQGETVIYDTQALAVVGDDVVIELARGGVIVRELLTVTDAAFRLKQYSPGAVTTIPRENVATMHPVIARCNSQFYDEVTGQAQAAT